MTDLFESAFGEAWEKTKPPLEKHWDKMLPDWENHIDLQVDEEIKVNHGGITIREASTGMSIRCNICNSIDGWKPEGERPYSTPVAVCDHGIAGGVIRQVDSHRLGKVYFEE